ncbi:hypothetical protein SCALM49S_04716 [Streptomyces californicus]
MARLREHLPDLRARTLTRRAVPVESATPLSEALRRANEAGARALVVVDGQGNPKALVREAAIVGVPEHRRPWVAVSGLSSTDYMKVPAELAGEALLDRLKATPATEYLVVGDRRGCRRPPPPTWSAPSSRPWPAPAPESPPARGTGGGRPRDHR